MPSPAPITPEVAARIEAAVSPQRFASYHDACGGDLVAAAELYRWNGELAGACWQTLGHVEVVLRNALATRMQTRHRRRRGTGSWLDNPGSVLDARGAQDVATARGRVHANRKVVDDGQIVSELSFGFWRFLLAARYTSSLWPDLARAFPHAPSRNRRLVEDPVVRLHHFRNRLAHQQRVWNQPVADRLVDCLLLTGYIDPTVRDWIGTTSTVAAVLTRQPTP